jgi:hypothetical protein
VSAIALHVETIVCILYVCICICICILYTGTGDQLGSIISVLPNSCTKEREHQSTERYTIKLSSPCKTDPFPDSRSNQVHPLSTLQTVPQVQTTPLPSSAPRTRPSRSDKSKRQTRYMLSSPRRLRTKTENLRLEYAPSQLVLRH